MRNLNTSRKLVSYGVGRVLRVLNRGLHSLECALLEESQGTPLEFAPVFIIGAPRSGSTLLYQLMLDSFDLGYFSNLHATFYGMPSFLERVVRMSRRRPPRNYRSDYGRTKGWNAPSECGQFWYRFFRRKPAFVTTDDVDPRTLRTLRAVVGAFSKACKKPVLFKNLYSSVRLLPLAEAFPEALFIIVRRDEIEMGCSLLRGRLRKYGSYDRWFSVEPPSVDSLRHLPPHEQVVKQVRDIYALIEEHRVRIGTGRFAEVRYEDLCDDPNGVLGELQVFFRKHGLGVGRQNDVPERFSRDQTVHIDRRLYEKMKQYALLDRS